MAPFDGELPAIDQSSHHGMIAAEEARRQPTPKT
jgi:hypothetical protein